MREDASGRLGRGDREVVLWRCARHGVRSGQGGLRNLQMWPKSGGVPAVLGGAMTSLWIGRSRSQVPSVDSPEYVGGVFCEVDWNSAVTMRITYLRTS
jgi:hypothetical protein